jgi:hypothetical protein
MSLYKSRPKCSQTHVDHDYYIPNLNCEISWQKLAKISLIFKKTAPSKHPPNRRKFAQSGHPDSNPFQKRELMCGGCGPIHIEASATTRINFKIISLYFKVVPRPQENVFFFLLKS